MSKVTQVLSLDADAVNHVLEILWCDALRSYPYKSEHTAGSTWSKLPEAEAFEWIEAILAGEKHLRVYYSNASDAYIPCLNYC